MDHKLRSVGACMVMTTIKHHGKGNINLSQGSNFSSVVVWFDDMAHTSTMYSECAQFVSKLTSKFHFDKSESPIAHADPRTMRF